MVKKLMRILNLIKQLISGELHNENNKNIVDYSDGSHGHNDQNDWEVFDLTFFQTEGKVIEDPGFEPPGQEEI